MPLASALASGFLLGWGAEFLLENARAIQHRHCAKFSPDRPNLGPIPARFWDMYYFLLKLYVVY
jgi:hypothetical protein